MTLVSRNPETGGASRIAYTWLHEPAGYPVAFATTIGDVTGTPKGPRQAADVMVLIKQGNHGG